jgi:catechol-2,3-dioxygenase
MTVPAKVTRVGHVGLRARDLSRLGEFYTDTWGLGLTEEGPGALYLRAEEPSHHAVALYDAERDQNAVDHLGLEVASRDDLARGAEALAARGLEIVQAPGRSDEPGLGYAMRFHDPAGQLVELYTDPERIADDYGTPPVKPTKVSHVVLMVPDVDAAVAVYRDVLGFREIDWNGHWMAFLNCAPAPPSLALVAAPETPLHHLAFEVHLSAELARGIYALGEKQVPRVWGPGRHGAGNNVFSYFWDPDKNVVEYTCEIEQVDERYVPRVWERQPGQPDWWCACPPNTEMNPD